jgi:hypothetical protein
MTIRTFRSGDPSNTKENSLGKKINTVPKLEHYSDADCRAVIEAVKYNPSIANTLPNIYSFIDKYKEIGVDLMKVIDEGAKTTHEEEVKKAFLENREYGIEASLAESLPFFANSKGMVGDFFEIEVTKTLKQDDIGGSFTDFVLEIKNTWIENGAPRELQNVPAKMTFLIDITSAEGSEKYAKKVDVLRNIFLLYGKKAKVLCYEDTFGELGIERPKLLVKESPLFLNKIGSELGSCITQSASDKFTINRPHDFQEAYRKYFLDLMNAIAENAQENASYLQSLSQDNPKRKQLENEYKKIVAFIEVYKKTPTTKNK